MKRLSYQPSLDGLRGIAILAVMLYHVQIYIYRDAPIASGYLSFGMGFLGVDLFFVLSGLLITTLLIQEWERSEQIDLRNFYIRRALRLLPALFVFLIVMVAHARLTMDPQQASITTQYAGLAVLYVANWASAFGWLPVPELMGHLWSLAIEEQFYLVWPLFFLLLLRSRTSVRVVTAILMVAVVFIWGYRLYLASHGGGFSRVYFATDTRADALLVGCWVAVIRSQRNHAARYHRHFKQTALVLALAALASLIVLPLPVARVSMLSIFAMACGLVLMRVVESSSNRILELPWLVWMGELSYSLYLWHTFAMIVTLKINVPNSLRSVIGFSLSFAFASASFYLIERPFLKLKRRFSAGGGHGSDVHEIGPVTESLRPNLPAKSYFAAQIYRGR